MALRIVSTPIEVHKVAGRSVFVKRDDLCCDPPAPPLGKLRGLDAIVSSLTANGHRTIGCWDTRVSKLGVGLAAAMRDVRGGRAVFCYPQLKNGPVPETVLLAEALGADIVSMRGNHVSICYAQARKIVEARGGVMLPFGLECAAAVGAVAGEAQSVPARHLANGTVVLSCGSGVTLSGLLRGLRPQPHRVIGISAGRSLAKLRGCVLRYVGEIPRHLVLVPAAVPYDFTCTDCCPFPAHPNYDRKAWRYLSDNIKMLKPPVLFWNIGA